MRRHADSGLVEQRLVLVRDSPVHGRVFVTRAVSAGMVLSAYPVHAVGVEHQCSGSVHAAIGDHHFNPCGQPLARGNAAQHGCRRTAGSRMF